MTQQFISLCEPHLAGKEWFYVKECLDSGWVSTSGSFIDRFEKEISSVTGSPFSVGVSSGTCALHVALLVAGVQENDEVIVPSLTFVAPVNAIRYCRAQPVFMDAHPQTWQMDVKKIAQFLKEECVLENGICRNKKSGRKVGAILAIHLLGFACEMDLLVDLAKEYHLKIVEDACEGMGVFYKKRHVGTFGDIGVLSFNGNKIVTSGGGGMLLTSDKSLADRARYLIHQAKEDPIEYFHREMGFNYRMTNLHAALGLAQLEQLPTFIQKKREMARYYEEALKDIEGLSFMPKIADCEPTYWLYTVLLDEKTTLEERKKIIAQLNQNGIGARPLWHTTHDLPLYKEAQAYQIQHCVRLYERGISLPSGVGLDAPMLERVCKTLKQCLLSQKN